MCYMSEGGNRSARVGVRELRQNLSVYLDRVKDGETLEVTERGQPVAKLGPLPAGNVTAYARLLADGHIRPASGDLLDIGSPLASESGERSLTQILLDLRDEERW